MSATFIRTVELSPEM